MGQVVEHLPSMNEDLDSLPNIAEKERQRERKL
jgi:hypothetical protein